MKKLINTDTELKKSVAYTKKRVLRKINMEILKASKNNRNSSEDF